MILVSLSLNSLKEKNSISLCIRRIQYEEQWKRRLWKATELKTFPSWFSSLKLAGAKCQSEMKETTRRIKTGSVMAKTWSIRQQTSNVQHPTLIHKYFDNALLIKFSFSIYRQTARASQTHCLRYQLYEVVPRVLSPSQVSYVSDAVSYVSYVSYSRTQTVLGACSSYQQPLLLMLYSQRICTWLFNCVPFLALLGFFFGKA